MGQGAYARARQRFEYVIQLDPGYPEASEKLAEVLLELSTTATPTLLPTASSTPTADMRDAQQFFDKAQQALAASDWSTAIDEMLALRKVDPAFRTVDIDGMLFLALRNRGRDQILKESDLESGIYDLTLASQIWTAGRRSSGSAKLEQYLHHRRQLLGHRLGAGSELFFSGSSAAAKPDGRLKDDRYRALEVSAVRIWQHIGSRRAIL